MNEVMQVIEELIDVARNKNGFLDTLFGIQKQSALNGRPVVIFGAGALGEEFCTTLRNQGIQPSCFCDNDVRKSGSNHAGLPVISFDELKIAHRESLIVIASLKYSNAITDQLLQSGFEADRLLCKASDEWSQMIYMFAMVGTQNLFNGYEATCAPESVLNRFGKNQERISSAYRLLSDDKSKRLFLTKLALMASERNFSLFVDFMQEFSEPLREFGFGGFEGTPEDYYYFNNDVLDVTDGETFVDVGAYDGDTVLTFTQACSRKNVGYKRIIAFEPDPHCYEQLERNTAGIANVELHQVGIWSHSGVMRFISSEKAIHDQAGIISGTGDVEIEVVSLDDFLAGQEASFIKMDPGGNVIPEAIKGSATTLAKFRPKLAVGAYHGLESIYELPLLLNQICPDYRLYLRHNTFHLCDTDLYALV